MSPVRAGLCRGRGRARARWSGAVRRITQHGGSLGVVAAADRNRYQFDRIPFEPLVWSLSDITAPGSSLRQWCADRLCSCSFHRAPTGRAAISLRPRSVSPDADGVMLSAFVVMQTVRKTAGFYSRGPVKAWGDKAPARPREQRERPLTSGIAPDTVNAALGRGICPPAQP
jgi:hypothetical protein